MDFIANLRQTEDLSTLPVGRRVVVIGGGMTAVDAAVQSKLLGAEEVHMVYRRGPEAHVGLRPEQEWAQTHGVTIHHWLAPVEVLGRRRATCSGVRFAAHSAGGRPAVATGEQLRRCDADMVLKAIGQSFGRPACWRRRGLTLKAAASPPMPKARPASGVWAGGDCRAGGLDLTVEAVEHGKVAARRSHARLTAA